MGTLFFTSGQWLAVHRHQHFFFFLKLIAILFYLVLQYNLLYSVMKAVFHIANTVHGLHILDWLFCGKKKYICGSVLIEQSYLNHSLLSE